VSISGAGQLQSPSRTAFEFELDGRWGLSGQVALRQEPFGALAYHFGNRRLSILKSRTLLQLVETLATHASAREACRAVGVPDAELSTYTRALGVLASSGMIERRP
jgi:putative mycofactocin binding protein MftB